MEQQWALLRYWGNDSRCVEEFQANWQSIQREHACSICRQRLHYAVGASAMFFYPDRDAAMEMSGESSRTTHGAAECIEASQLFGAMLFIALAGGGKEDILLGYGASEFSSAGILAIANGEYRTKAEPEIFGIGYVVPSLEAALWCFYHTDNFRDAILKATNLGKDSDTTAAICGQIAGAFYGENGIPENWRKKLAMHDEVCLLADRLAKLC